MKFDRLTLAFLAPLLLTGCLFTPGKFSSGLDINRDQSFAFAYTGEILFSADPKATNGMAGGDEDEDTTDISFEPPCMDDEGESRACTADEKEAQAKAAAARKDERAKRRSEMAKVFGVDPENEASMKAFAEALSREAGWKSVEYLGEGKFKVDYALTGTLDRDFVWPVYPKMEMVFPLVVIRKRADGAVQVIAPGFANGGSKSGMENPFGRAGGKADGTFTIRTDAEVVTNNTDDGPVREGARQKLVWKVDAFASKTPETLIRFGR